MNLAPRRTQRRHGHTSPALSRRLRCVSLAAAALLLVLALAGCARREDPRLAFLEETEPRPFEGVPVGEERIAELRGEIARLGEEARQQAARYGRIASYQKLLAWELMQLELFGPALDALDEALEIQTENAVLYQLAAVCSARLAKADVAETDVGMLQRAERLYRRALDLRPEFQEALYGISVLLAFELERPEEALEYARELARIETGEPNVRFLLANILVRVGELDEAADVYADLARTAPAAEQRRRAERNRQELLEVQS